jgi:hypothetical protein
VRIERLAGDCQVLADPTELEANGLAGLLDGAAELPLPGPGRLAGPVRTGQRRPVPAQPRQRRPGRQEREQ